MDGTATRSGRGSGDDGRYSRIITIAAPSPAAPLPPGDIVATAALAAVETTARLGRRHVIRVLAAGQAADLPDWPGGIRRQPGPQARAEVRALLVPGAGELPNGCLVVSLDRQAPSGLAGGSVHFGCDIRDGVLTVTTWFASGDPWLRARSAVAEVFAEVFGALVADPLLPSAAAPGIGAASRQLALRFAGRAVDYGEFHAIPALIERQASQTPDRPALSFGHRTLTYRDLDELANGLAATLSDRGVGRGDVVPALLVNSLELPVSYLALMKLGAAFVPLDPAWPASRIGAALGVLSPRLLLCAAVGQVPGEFRARTLTVDVDRVCRVTRAAADHLVALRPDDVIYGIFTSGTTGVPKCAMNRHAGLANRFEFMTRYFAATGAEVVLQNSKHTFDSAVWQLFWPLTTGGRAVIPAQGEFLNLEHTIDTIGTHAITITDFVPSIFNVMVAIADRDERALRKLSSLRHLVVGGEEINPQMVHRLLALLPGLRITNGYGPTETSIGMVFHQVSDADHDAIPLGRPIDNCYALVVDDELNLLPPGASGEIAVGGICVGDGYYGDPGRTAEVFVTNPFTPIPGDRLYLTGDLGCVDPGGRLFFLGRKDLQVKIGGVRIELGEIEVAAESCPGVRHARVLLARQGDTKSLALFATGDPELTEADLRDCLRAALPRTSMPRYFYVLAEMPLTDNGKVDRQALQGMLEDALARDAARLAARAPVTALRDRVLRVFRSVLGYPGLSAFADFMEAGGDSMRALSAVAELSAAVPGGQIGVQDLFDNPTAERMARFIELRRTGEVSVEAEAALMERDAAAPVPGAPPAGAAPVTAAPVTAAPVTARSATMPAAAPKRAACPQGDPQTVLLTGATGFVGSRLAHELLATTGMRVVCLVRAGDDSAAVARVTGALACRGLWRPEFAGRLQACSADLARPGLGLDPATWQELAHACDLVLHCGALVNFLFDYRAHRAANVAGTAELLRLAMTGRAKPFHHISTLGVLSGEAGRSRGRLREDIEISSVLAPASGYSRSKWVAERYLAAARRRGAPVTIIRLGEVMPSADNGHPNTRALTHLLLSAFTRLGACPDAEIWSDYTPVDYAAARLVAAVRDRGAWRQTMHIYHPETVSFTRLLARAGAGMDRIAGREFVIRLHDAARDQAGRDLATLAALLPLPPDGSEAATREMFAGLLSDNPGLYRKDICRSLELRWRLTDGPLDAPVAAYRSYLSRTLGGAAQQVTIG
jgi:amino acid adenylation domain-containing protein/thioester reductase-like protein